MSKQTWYWCPEQENILAVNTEAALGASKVQCECGALLDTCDILAVAE